MPLTRGRHDTARPPLRAGRARRHGRVLRPSRRGGRARHLVVATAVAALAVGCGVTSPDGTTDEVAGAPATSWAAPAPDPGPCRPATDPGTRSALTRGGETSATPTGGPEDAVLWTLDLNAQLSGNYSERSAGAWFDPDTLEVVLLLTAPDPDADPDTVAAMPDEDIVADVAASAEDPEVVVCQRARATRAELASLSREAIARLEATDTSVSGGPRDLEGLVRLDYEGDLEVAVDALGELAEHPGMVLERPECSVFDPAAGPDGATPLPGDGSNCDGGMAEIYGVLDGDPETGCLFLTNDHDEGGASLADDDGTPKVLLWPAGWTVTPDGTVHDQHGEPRATIGDQTLSFGGYSPPRVLDVPDACTDATGTLVVNHLSESS